jgi:osmoprotectant transport system substrate-binding protein
MRARLATLLALGAVGILLALALALAGCGGGDDPPDGPSQSPDPVRLGTKNFTEQYILGELYAQAMRARGIPVELKSDIGSSEIVDQAMQIGSLDMYPEYTGVLLSEIAGVSRRPPSAEATFAAAQKFERTRGYDLLTMTPFSNSNALAVTHKTATKYGLRTIGDLARIPGGATIAAPPEFRTRFEGLVGLRDRYMLSAKVVAMPIGQQYKALNDGRVDAAAVFATDGMLEDEEYVILRDPRNLFSFQNVTPVVRSSVLARTPELAKAIDPVSAKLTTDAMRRMNAQVDIDGMEPAEVAKQFLEREGLL